MIRGKRGTSSPDYLFIALLFILVVFGLVMLTSASSDLAMQKFGNSYYYFNHQLLFGLLPGVIGFIIGMLFYYRAWEKWAVLLLLLNIALLILVFTPLGFHANGGDRWLNFGSFTFQPSELLKLTFFVFIAAWMSRNKERSRNFREGFLPFLVLTGSVVLLLLLEPSTTIAALIFATALIVYFVAGARIRFLAVAVLCAALGLSLLIYFSPYRFARVITFLNPQQDQLGSSYHINQALLAIGSGGFTGVGFGKSTTKLNYLPEPIGDSIFAVIAEELGLVGALFVVIVFLLFVWRGIMIARASPDGFAQLLVICFVTLIGLQAFVNIAAISGLIPLTGVPLPFVSYGGTALSVFLTMSGIIVNISKYRRLP